MLKTQITDTTKLFHVEQSDAINELEIVDYNVQSMICKRSFKEFVKHAFPILEPGIEFKDNWHIDLICEYLELVSKGEINRLIINIPPRYMKSILVSVLFPCWEWTKQPENRYLCASYSHGLSVKHNVDRRVILESYWYRKCFWDSFLLSDDHNTKNEFSNNKRGYMGATSIGGTATGKGGNRIIIDDPQNPKEAYSDVIRESVNRDFDQTFTTRLDDKEKGAMILVMQRLHENDLTGHLLKKGGWVHLKLPGIAEQDEIIEFPLSKKKIKRPVGNVLWAERESKKEVLKTKIALGSYGFAGQYQQRPSPKEGGTFKKHWWKFYSLVPKTFDVIIQSWDCAFKDTQGSSYVVGQVWGKIEAQFYLIYQLRERLNFPDTLSAIRSMKQKYPLTNQILVEDKANGPAVISVLKKHITGIIPIEPDGSKEARASAISPLVEAGNVFLPNADIAPWIDDYIEELATFPNSEHNDQVDATSQALRRLEELNVLNVDDIETGDNMLDKYSW